MFVLLAVTAALIELAVGYPNRVFTIIGHPVTWMGSIIAAMDARWNRAADSFDARRKSGIVAIGLLVGIVGSVAMAVQIFAGSWFGFAIVALVASSLIAQRSLYTHVAAVAEALEKNGLEGGRRAVSQIVGRDPESLDEAGVARAAIESLAENFSDGVVAPLFWLALLGLPGAAIYKAVNTADSMIGHRTERHEAFGWAAARFDDLINLPASRLAGLLIAGAAMFQGGASTTEAWRAMRRDARRHRSPNAGWPEAAMAGALGLALAGPRRYGGVLVEDATMGDGGRRAANAADIRRALKLYRGADALLVMVLGAAAFMLHG